MASESAVGLAVGLVATLSPKHFLPLPLTWSPRRWHMITGGGGAPPFPLLRQPLTTAGFSSSSCSYGFNNSYTRAGIYELKTRKTNVKRTSNCGFFASSVDNSLVCGTLLDRRKAIIFAIAQLATTYLGGAALASQFADMPALKGKDYGKTRMRYPDYTETKSGLQYKDLRVGNGPTPRTGETVVVDWDGYTIGYYGRIFEARNKTKGGSFEGGEKDFFKFKIGSQEVIPAFEEAVSGMAVGGIRRIIVPPDLGYPENDYNKQGPRPTTFSGQRALDFVLRNQGLIDKTLLFDIELLKIVPN